MKKLLCGLLALALAAATPAVAQVTAPIPMRVSALSNTPVAIKTSAGTIQWGQCYNPNVAVTYVQVFDATTPLLGTTAPTLSLAIAGSSNLPILGPTQFFTAIKVAATTTATGGSAPVSALDCNFGFN